MNNLRSNLILKVVHLLALALWGGGAVCFSFVVAPSIFQHLAGQLPANPPPGVQGISIEVGRRLAGDTVGLIFPRYFAGQILLGVLAVVAGFVLARAAGRVERIRCALVLAALVITTLHAVTVYPRSVRVRAEQYQAQSAGDEPKAEELRKSFGMLHGISQLLNLTTIVLVVVALVLVGVTLRDPR